MLSLISLFLRFPSYFPSKFRIAQLERTIKMQEKYLDKRTTKNFLKHRPLVPPAEVQPNSMLNLTLSLWYKEDCKNTIYPFTPFLDLVLVGNVAF
jgi:hypothetical protein